MNKVGYLLWIIEMAQGNFLFTKHNAKSKGPLIKKKKSKGPHMNMIQNFEKLAWENFQSSFLTEIKVQTFEKVKLLRCLTSSKKYDELVLIVL